MHANGVLQCQPPRSPRSGAEMYGKKENDRLMSVHTSGDAGDV